MVYFCSYSFLWAVLEAFLLRMKSEPEYLSILKLIVHLLQALGIPIKCMATPSLLEYPVSLKHEISVGGTAY